MADTELSSSATVYVPLGGAADASCTASSATAAMSHKKAISRAVLALVMLGLVILGPTNYILFKVMYSAYGDKFSYFVSQGINMLYLIYGGAVLYPRMMFTDKITPRMRAFPQWKLLGMGVLDSFGTFFAAMGAVYTPGQYQLLLNQTLIPFTMAASAAFLGSRYRKLEMFSAALIVCGACVTVLPGVLWPSATGTHTRWYAVLIYFLSNVPMACSAVYKELKFSEANLDVWYLTQWVSFYQLLVGFAFAPALVLPGFASEHGVPWSEIKSNFWKGLQCYLQVLPDKMLNPETGESHTCTENNAFLLLTGYCFVNVLYNTLGLFLVKEGSAVLNGLSFSLVLPFSTLAFSLPFLGVYSEALHGTTFIGLLIVMVGFSIYQYVTRSVGQEEEEEEEEEGEEEFADHGGVDEVINCIADLGDIEAAAAPSAVAFNNREQRGRSRTVSRTSQSTFQERVIGMGYAHRPPRMRRKKRRSRRKDSGEASSFGRHFHY